MLCCRGFLELLRLTKYTKAMSKLNIHHFRTLTVDDLTRKYGFRLGAANRLFKASLVRLLFDSHLGMSLGTDRGLGLANVAILLLARPIGAAAWQGGQRR